jgi:L-lactate dehydrogenase complex protein LldG
VERIPNLDALGPLLDHHAPASARLVASTLPAAGMTPSPTDTAHTLQSVHTVVVQGRVAIAEDASILVDDLDALGPASARLRGSAFLAIHLMVVLPTADVVATLHHAFERPTVRTALSRSDFAVWISGPSKTADIEQTLVHGAHGPERLTVVLVEA